jgi:tRNA (mo5U34)-methyltransferase
MDLSKDSEFTARVQRWVQQLDGKVNYHALELPNGETLPGVIPVEALRKRLEDLQFPKALNGKTVLDVGAASGWNSFEAERRGGIVTALDCVRYDELDAVKSLTGSKLDYRIEDVDMISPERIGRFDYILFLGVLYHLRHPLHALERVCSVTLETAFIESYVIDTSDSPDAAVSMHFYECDELGGQIDNWWGPTTKCLLAMCRSAGFIRVQLLYSEGGRAGVIAHRRWENPPQFETAPIPYLVAAVNNRDGKKAFHKGKDEYLCLYFRFPGKLDKEALRIEVGGFGATALILVETATGEWQANTRIPPGLEVGLQPVRLRHSEASFSREVYIEIFDGWTEEIVTKTKTPESEVGSGSVNTETLLPIELYRVANTFDSSLTFTGRKSERLSAFFRINQPALTEQDLSIFCDDQALTELVLNNIGDGNWQVNVALPKGLSPGPHEVHLRTTKSLYSNRRLIELRPELLQEF